MPEQNIQVCPEMEFGIHCFHHTGVTTHADNQGCDYGLCCHCGQSMRQQWRIERKPIPGHGPHAWQNVKVVVKQEAFESITQPRR